MKKFTVKLTFLTPFRIVPWSKKNKRNSNRFYLRGGKYVKWHMLNEKKQKGRPYITGSNLRSAISNQLEYLLIHYDPFDCCLGIDETKDKSNLAFVRRKFKFIKDKKNHKTCNTCPLCLLLNNDRSKSKFKDNNHKKENKKDTSLYSVHFSNLSADSKEEDKRKNYIWPETVTPHIANRVDLESGKAKDYMTIWEIDPAICSVFEGEITINDSLLGEKADQVLQLIASGLSLITNIAGATCRVEIDPRDIQEALVKAFWNDEKDNKSEPPDINFSLPEKLTEIDSEQFANIAGQIAALLIKAHKEPELRLLADIIRDLR